MDEAQNFNLLKAMEQTNEALQRLSDQLGDFVEEYTKNVTEAQVQLDKVEDLVKQKVGTKFTKEEQEELDNQKILEVDGKIKDKEYEN